MPHDVTPKITASRDQTLQSQIRNRPDETMGLVWWLARAGQTISPWWSQVRDKELREFWKRTDYLAGAVFTMTAKMTTIPFTIVPRNTAIKDYVKQGEKISEDLSSAAQFGEGWNTFYSRWVEDLITQDNGAFAEIIGPGNPAGPLTGRPTSIAHLDSSRCQRTGNPEFPVLYRDIDGKVYKLHYTRVLFASQMSSPINEMNGVGFCSVSRCVNVSQALLDILLYKQEKLGSRPHRAIIITKGGLDPQDLANAFQLAEGDMDSAGFSRYSKIVIAGSSTIEDASHELIELSSLPEGFNEETSVTLGMATIALAFGVDPRELFPGLTPGSTRAEALLAHLKQRSKGPGQILDITERLFNLKFLPPHLKMEFAFQDDTQDRQVADIRFVRAQRRNLDLNSGAVTTRSVREDMLRNGEITEDEFHDMELRDGRTPDGYDVLSLFYSNDPLRTRFLDLGVPDPLDFFNVDPHQLLPLIQQNLTKARGYLVNNWDTFDDTDVELVMCCIGALVHLKHVYLKVIDSGETDPEKMMVIAEHEHVVGYEGGPEGGQTKTGPNPTTPPADGKGPQPPILTTPRPPYGGRIRTQDATTAAVNSTTNPREIQRGQMMPDQPGGNVTGMAQAQ